MSMYLAKFGSFTDHQFDPRPTSGRCATCGISGDVHPVNIRSVKPRP